MVTVIHRSALVIYSAEQMYNLVNDVTAYPSYMEGCVGAEILEQGDDYMVARLDLKKGAISQSFTTRNQLHPPYSIKLGLEQGPFERLEGEWSFKVLTEKACKIMLALEFETSGMSVGLASARLFGKVANNMVDAMCRRAEKVYGK